MEAVGAIATTFTCALAEPLVWLMEISPDVLLKAAPVMLLAAEAPARAETMLCDDITFAWSVESVARFACAFPVPAA
ncbi:hypothetical protein [Ralstonia mannitolilytica]|uniref:hypothetical protein n=1 Tax=Ralstonia mannitolilytica TaxID=105219 RepID=UPI00242A571D|nr:hypothetical protein [Ralstonia mannitolilytica]